MIEVIFSLLKLIFGASMCSLYGTLLSSVVDPNSAVWYAAYFTGAVAIVLLEVTVADMAARCFARKEKP